MYHSILEASTRKKHFSAASKPRRRAALLQSLESLEVRALMSQLTVLSAVGIGGDSFLVNGLGPNTKVGSTAIDSQGDVFTCGEFAGNVNFDPAGGAAGVRSTPGEFDMYVAEYSSTGSLIWIDQFSPSTSLAAGSIPCAANGLAVDGSGNVYVTGEFSNEMNFTPNPNTGSARNVTPKNIDAFVLKLGAGGTFQNVVDYGDDTTAHTGIAVGTSITVDPSGNNVLVVGNFTNTINFNPQDTTGGGRGTSSPTGVQNGFAVEMNSSFSFNWAVKVNSPVGPFAAGFTSGAFDPTNDSAYVGGFFGNDASGDTNAVIAKVSATGNIQSQEQIGDQSFGEITGKQHDAVEGIVVDSQQNVYVSGNFAGNGVNFNDNGNGTSITLTSSSSGTITDSFVAQFNSNLAVQWADRLGSGSANQPVTNVGVAVDAANDVFVGGTFQAPATYGTNSSRPGQRDLPHLVERDGARLVCASG